MRSRAPFPSMLRWALLVTTPGVLVLAGAWAAVDGPGPARSVLLAAALVVACFLVGLVALRALVARAPGAALPAAIGVYVLQAGLLLPVLGEALRGSGAGGVPFGVGTVAAVTLWLGGMAGGYLVSRQPVYLPVETAEERL